MLAVGRGRHLERHRCELANLDLHGGASHGREPLQLGGEPIDSDANGQPEFAGAVSDRNEGVTRFFVRCGDGHAGQHPARGVSYSAVQCGVLCVPSDGKNQHPDNHQPR